MMYTQFIGIDISKNTFDMACYGDTQHYHFENNKRGFKQFISSIKEQMATSLIVVEATGGYEAKFIKFCIANKLAIHKADSKVTYSFLKSLNKFSKNDRIDAIGLAQYAYDRQQTLKLYDPKSSIEEELCDLSCRQNTCSQMIAQEKNRLKSPVGLSVKKDIEQHIKFLEKQLENLRHRSRELIKQDALMRKKLDVLTEMDGIGEVIGTVLIAEAPELGRLNQKQIASLAGLAPHPKDSGQKTGYRKTVGGRKSIRNKIFIAALTVVRGTNRLAIFYKGLIARGKAKMVALTAVMRKIVIIANAKIKKLLSDEAASIIVA